MVARGRVQNGVVVLDEGSRLTEGLEVTVVATGPIGESGKTHSILDIPPVSLGSIVRPMMSADEAGQSAVERLMDFEYHGDCEADTSPEVPLADVRAGLASIPGDMRADFTAERDDR